MLFLSHGNSQTSSNVLQKTVDLIRAQFASPMQWTPVILELFSTDFACNYRGRLIDFDNTDDMAAEHTFVGKSCCHVDDYIVSIV
jgi:hypothetical protein